MSDDSDFEDEVVVAKKKATRKRKQVKDKDLDEPKPAPAKKSRAKTSKKELSEEDSSSKPTYAPYNPPVNFSVPVSKTSKNTGSVDAERVRFLFSSKKEGLIDDTELAQRPVVYWMSRDQRVQDNWALLYAQHQANLTNSPLAVVFNLANGFLGATIRQFGFMIRGLAHVQADLAKKNIPFFLLRGSEVGENIGEFAVRNKLRLLVTDFSPLRINRIWKNKLMDTVKCKVFKDCHIEIAEVDAHNVVPAWYASDKIEYAARTIRPKINNKLGRFLVEYPKLHDNKVIWNGKDESSDHIDWDDIIANLDVDKSVPEVSWIEPGEVGAHEVLKQFLEKKLKKYDTDRNDPNLDGLSNISPFLHFGHISSQRVALEVRKASRVGTSKSAEAYLEELIVRRELSENFVHYNPDGYDRLDCLYPQYENKSWAQKTLDDHRHDRRDPLYTLEELEKGKTYDQLWNASQMEVVHTGKMHGFMRMYWAKKILEWTKSPEKALEYAIYLNDKYQLDGRDPNGYVGCAWSVAGLHDQGWRERPIFGKIRYMNYEGCARKFNVAGYIAKVKKLMKK